jgi:hypothetical protein
VQQNVNLKYGRSMPHDIERQALPKRSRCLVVEIEKMFLRGLDYQLFATQPALNPCQSADCLRPAGKNGTTL